METFINFLTENLLSLALVGCALIIYFFKFIIKKILENHKKKKFSKMSENKEKQKEKEKELNKMAKFLCDCCGKETDVKRACGYDAFDVCPSCLNELNANEKAYKKAKEEFEKAEAILNEKKERLLKSVNLLSKEEVKPVEEVKKEEIPTKTETAKNDILSKLGLK